MTLFLIAAAAWLLCGALAAGVIFAHHQREFAYICSTEFDLDRKFALITGLLTGPLGLLAVVSMGGWRHGWMNPYSRTARRDAFIRQQIERGGYKSKAEWALRRMTR